jgi:hypothetical protein
MQWHPKTGKVKLSLITFIRSNKSILPDLRNVCEKYYVYGTTKYTAQKN